MKKLLALILVSLMLMSMAGCAKEVSNDPDEPTDDDGFIYGEVYESDSDTDWLFEDDDYLESLQDLIGTWEFVSIYQKADKSDGNFDSAEKALNYAKEYPMTIGAIEFDSPEYSTDSEPFFNISDATDKDLADDGIKVNDKYLEIAGSDTVKKIDVYGSKNDEKPSYHMYLLSYGTILCKGPDGHFYLAELIIAEG